MDIGFIVWMVVWIIFFMLGIGTIICINHMDFRDEQVAVMMKQTVADMVQGAKRGAL